MKHHLSHPRAWVLAAFLLGGSSSHLEAAGSSYGLLRGIVVDSDGHAIPGAVVRLGKTRLTTQADRNGLFSIRIPSATYEVHVTAPGFGEDVVKVTLPQGEVRELAAVLPSPPDGAGAP